MDLIPRNKDQNLTTMDQTAVRDMAYPHTLYMDLMGHPFQLGHPAMCPGAKDL